MVDEGFQVYNLQGELQMRIPLSTLSKYGSQRVVYHRVDLHEALKQRATAEDQEGRPVMIKTSSRVRTCDCEAGVVGLESGVVIKADLIVSADGIKSVIRDAVLGKEASAHRTGHSAYRVMVPMQELEKEKEFVRVVDPRKSFTTMVMGHDRRLIMGPARNASVYSVVAMVPDETMGESSEDSSWTTTADLAKMLETFSVFPEWAKAPLRLAREAGLWQLRDLDPLSTWHKGRAILIGDAAHAMLPTQGQGASQSVEDAEALGAFFAEFEGGDRSYLEVTRSIKNVFDCRFERASMIQMYSRQTAKPATEPGSVKIKMNPAEFMDYNCLYDGALDWQRRQEKLKGGEDLTEILPLQRVTISA